MVRLVPSTSPQVKRCQINMSNCVEIITRGGGGRRGWGTDVNNTDSREREIGRDRQSVREKQKESGWRKEMVEVRGKERWGER